MINRGITNNVRNDQRLLGNNRNSINDRFINTNRNPIRDHNRNNNIVQRESRYNCTSDGIFPDIISDCQKYFVCQGSQVIFTDNINN